MLAKEHIGHIHVALVSLTGAGDDAIDRTGELFDVGGELPDGLLSKAFAGTGLLIASETRFDNFGNRVILGDDLRKPA